MTNFSLTLPEISIKNFDEIMDHLKAIRFNSNIEIIEPEVAKEMLKNIPVNIKDAAKSTLESIDKEVAGNDKSMEKFADMCINEENACIRLAEKAEDFDDAKYWIERAAEPRRAYAEKDTENKGHKRLMAGIKFAVFFVLGIFFGSHFGTSKAK